MSLADLREQIARLPEQPGVYLYGNAAGETIYVGKARSLRDRVRSYLGARGSSPRTDALLDEASRLEVVVTDSVVEALALENHLIKQRAPKYNVLLRDDKNYPYLRLTTSEAVPRLLVARRVERDGDAYAGPFLPASLARRTMKLTHRLFGVRSCNEVITGRRDRPCLEYDIQRCVAPCVSDICAPATYDAAVRDARLFLEGRNEELLGTLRGRMDEAATAEQFERAAQLRDAIRTVEALRDRQQKIAGVRFGDRDVFGVKAGPAGACVLVFQVRRGKVVDRVELSTDAGGGAAGETGAALEAAVLEAAVQQIYEEQPVPAEIHVPVALPEAESIEAWLSARAGRRVRVVVPQRGNTRGLIDLAARNAALAFDGRFNVQGLAQYDALEELRQVLALPALPRRLECVDISTFQGSDTVASLVVCEHGRMRRSEYRKFRVRAEGGRILDDFASMRQVVARHARRLLAEAGPFPDLLVIDGGPGQLAAALDALREAGLDRLLAVGLAKREELIFTPDRREPIALPAGSPALHLLQRLRDEAHRFAVTFHRASRRTRDLQSELDGVPGIGPRRRRALLTQFGSVAGVRRASREDLTKVVGPRAADAVLAHFHGVV
jgi:excinuclease ABC subunit C